jgi:cytochrome P450
MRHLLMPPFHGERMRSYESVIRAACQEELDQWPAATAVEVRPAMQRTFMRVILQAVDALLYAEIAERRAHPERRGDDILSLPPPPRGAPCAGGAIPSMPAPW